MPSDENLSLQLKGKPGIEPFITLESGRENTGYNNYYNGGGGNATEAFYRFIYNFCIQPSPTAMNGDASDNQWMPGTWESRCPTQSVLEGGADPRGDDTALGY